MLAATLTGVENINQMKVENPLKPRRQFDFARNLPLAQCFVIVFPSLSAANVSHRSVPFSWLSAVRWELRASERLLLGKEKKVYGSEEKRESLVSIGSFVLFDLFFRS
jgi:hypothetical protein